MEMLPVTSLSSSKKE
ncbi:hypothetical protein LINGRAHAP2_LOCUS5199 [Linum grandiflorum]